MSNSIVKKLFLTIIGIFLLIMFIQLILQNFFLEDIYSDMKISKIEKNFDKFIEDFSEEKWNNLELNEETLKYNKENFAPILVINENKEILNEAFFEDFNYITIRDNNENVFKVIIDFLVDEEGNFKNNTNKINIGQDISVKGLSIEGTNYIETLEIISKETTLSSYDGFSIWDELYNNSPNVIREISGKVVDVNLILRDQGIFSYQQEKLYEELKNYLIESEKDPQVVSNILNEGRYEFIEEYSGLHLVVLVHRIQGMSDKPIYILTLFTLENVHDAFQILNSYYYYIFGFQLTLVFVLVFYYSRWITEPLVKLIDSAKSISELDFTKRTYITTNDELSILSNSLNNISENLSSTIKKLEESNEQLAIEAIEKAENEKRMRNLLSNLSHEFKTPLGIISGFLEIISDGVYEREPEYYIDVISDEITKLNDLVLETLELSKLEKGNYILEFNEFKIKDLIEELSLKFDRQLRDKEMKLKVDLNEDMVFGDKKRIEQVVNNLLSNAIRYSPNGESIEIYSKSRKSDLYLYIRNYGVKINDEDLEKIWDKFYRAEKSRNRNLGGSGLGLTIVKSILDLHESDYGVRNIKRAVEFYFSLTLKP